jgi:hypothetical protein
MIIIGIDPGPEHCGLCAIGTGDTLQDVNIIRCDKITVDEALDYIEKFPYPVIEVAIESMQSYGGGFGKSSIETCYVIGRLIQVTADRKPALYPRPEYGRWITGGGKVSDSLIRSALELQFGGYGKGEPLRALKGASDKRSAFAVAKYHESELRAKGVVK